MHLFSGAKVVLFLDTPKYCLQKFSWFSQRLDNHRHLSWGEDTLVGCVADCRKLFGQAGIEVYPQAELLPRCTWREMRIISHSQLSAPISTESESPLRFLFRRDCTIVVVESFFVHICLIYNIVSIISSLTLLLLLGICN